MCVNSTSVCFIDTSVACVNSGDVGSADQLGAGEVIIASRHEILTLCALPEEVISDKIIHVHTLTEQKTEEA